MSKYNYLLLPVCILISLCLAGCPSSTTPVKKEESSTPGPSSSTPSQPPMPSGAGRTKQADNSEATGSHSQGATPPAVTSGRQEHSSASTNSTASRADANINKKGELGDIAVDKSQKSLPPTESDSQTPNENLEQVSSEGQGAPETEPDFTDTEPEVAGQVTSATESTPTVNEVANESTSTASSNSASSSATSSNASSGPVGSSESGSAGKQGGAITAEERISVLDRQLAHSSGRFDQMILRERENIRSIAKSRGGSTLPVVDTLETIDSTISGEGERSSATRESVGASGNETMGKGGSPTQVITYAPPVDIPDGNDDDVVARQLREAAMVEPDPSLREKLWDEYRKYKGAN